MTAAILYHIASGQAFFSGIACLVVAVVLSEFARTRARRIGRNLLAWLGVALVFVSTTPLTVWSYANLFALTGVWWAAEGLGPCVPPRVTRLGRAAVILGCLAAGLIELPHHVMPSIPRMGHPALGVIGDSLTAGTGDETAPTWPKLLARDHSVDVRDHAEAGATVGSALRQAAALTPAERLVLLEIGGNDLLGSTTPAQFEERLAKLLAAVHRPGRVVVMLELPLPPTYNAFGLIQRRLAREHGTSLVPRRLLMGVILSQATTIDSIHLSSQGHQAMADAVWKLLHHALAPGPE